MFTLVHQRGKERITEMIKIRWRFTRETNKNITETGEPLVSVSEGQSDKDKLRKEERLEEGRRGSRVTC